MQQDELGSNPNPITNGLVLPPHLGFGEAMSKFVCGHLGPNSNELYGLQAAASFSSFPSINATISATTRGTDRLMEGIPLPNPTIANFPSERNISIADQENGVPINGFSPTFDTMIQQARSCYPREWATMEQTGLNSNPRNELSLTSSSVQDQSSGVTCYSSSFNSRPLLGARFLEAMQEILAEIACYALESGQGGATFSYSSSIDPSNGVEPNRAFVLHKLETTNIEANKKYLLALLQLVDDQYSQCLDEIHTVTSAFHAVTELDPNLHMRFALPTLSLMYKSLRERISSQILAHHKESPQARENKSLEACFIQKQWALQQLSKRENQLWRPQRGLPETSVSVLRTWMFQNFLHPYPKDSEKHLLALKSGLTRNQVSNWFINARVRLWKPMIEEMCAEMKKKKGGKEDEEKEDNQRNRMRIENRRFKRG